MITGFRVKQTVLLGLKSLWLHKLRSALTVLGMVFGVCSVIAMLAIGEGASYQAQEQIKQLGSTNIIVRAVKPQEDGSQASGGGVGGTSALQYGLTYNDAERIASTIPSVVVTVPVRKIPKTVWHEGRHADASILGTVPWYPDILNRKMVAGRFLSAADMELENNVCVLEPQVADELFPFNNGLGQTIKVGMDYYRVVGIIDAPGAKTASGASDRAEATTSGIYVPITTAQSRFGALTVQATSGSTQMELVELHEIAVRAKSIEYVEETAAIIKAIMARFHSKQDYELIVPLELLQKAQQIKRTFDIVLGSIAAISLLVGGIGIMNIMLASVTERTREIGIRRALGAKKKHIISQFLSETVILSGTGGFIGLIVGIIIPALVERFANMPTIVTIWSLVLAFSISGAVGVVFGIYPAIRAANMDPIEALRHE